mmetsp:Transcript_48711/g.76058  ORF Transcript_48711/g.76058 Transcript_48711/m.76058 type:complete len:99 (+) Transcript_48711:106-402(+)
MGHQVLLFVLLSMLMLTQEGSFGEEHSEPGPLSPADPRPLVLIRNPPHGAVVDSHEVRIDVEIQNYPMSLEEGCAVVYLNTQHRKKECQDRFSVNVSK